VKDTVAEAFQNPAPHTSYPSSPELPVNLTAIGWGKDVVYRSVEEIEQLLGELSSSVPRLLKENSGKEFWVEFLRHSNAIKEEASLDQLDWVTECIRGILARYGLPPPSLWILNAMARVS
jgi:hypothetical protein